MKKLYLALVDQFCFLRHHLAVELIILCSLAVMFSSFMILTRYFWTDYRTSLALSALNTEERITVADGIKQFEVIQPILQDSNLPPVKVLVSNGEVQYVSDEYASEVWNKEKEPLGRMFEKDDQIVMNRNLAQQQGYQISDIFSCGTQSYMITGLWDQENMVPLSSYHGYTDTYTVLLMKFEQELQEEQKVHLREFVEGKGCSISFYQDRVEEAFQQFFKNMSNGFLLILMALINLIFLLNFWLKSTLSRFSIYALCGDRTLGAMVRWILQYTMMFVVSFLMGVLVYRGTFSVQNMLYKEYEQIYQLTPLLYGGIFLLIYGCGLLILMPCLYQAKENIG